MVDIEALSLAEVVRKVRERLESTKTALAAIELGRTEEAYDDGAAATWRRRAQEDAAAIGGLRNPMSSILNCGELSRLV